MRVHTTCLAVYVLRTCILIYGVLYHDPNCRLSEYCTYVFLSRQLPLLVNASHLPLIGVSLFSWTSGL